MLLRLSRSELGRLVNCTRQMASRVLQMLETQGLIKVEGKSIIVYNTGSGRSVDDSENQRAGPTIAQPSPFKLETR